MTATQQRLANILSEEPKLVPFMPDEQAAQVIDIFMTVKVEAPTEDADAKRKALAKHRRELLKSRKYVRPSGRTHEEIDAEVREMRSDRF